MALTKVTSIMIEPAGRKNLLINGGFDVWQRGTSGFGHNSFNADRWVEYTNTNDSYNVQKINLSASDMTATGQSKALKVTTTAGTTGSLSDLRQKVEFPEKFHNKTLTLSFWYKSDSTATINNVRVGSIINSVFVAHLSGQTISATTIWQKASFTFTCSGMGVGTITANDHLDVIVSSPVGTTTTYYITGAQLELGSVATDFEHRSYGEELALCQRYYQEFGGAAYHRFASGKVDGAGDLQAPFPPIKEMRAGASLSTTGSFIVENSSGSPVVTGIVLAHNGLACNTATATNNSAGLLVANNDTTTRIKLDAEL